VAASLGLHFEVLKGITLLCIHTWYFRFQIFKTFNKKIRFYVISNDTTDTASKRQTCVAENMY
jgi:hypothetical protein